MPLLISIISLLNLSILQIFFTKMKAKIAAHFLVLSLAVIVTLQAGLPAYSLWVHYRHRDAVHELIKAGNILPPNDSTLHIPSNAANNQQLLDVIQLYIWYINTVFTDYAKNTYRYVFYIDTVQ